MPRNGSGSYSLPAGNPVVTQTLITSNWANTTLSDLAAAITQSLSRDGQTAPTADLPMAGFKHTGVSDPAARNQYMTLGYSQDGVGARLTSVIGANTITAVLPGGSTSLTTGQTIQLIPVANNTAQVTLNINGIGPKQVTTEIGSQLSAGNLISGRPYTLVYDGNKFLIGSGGGGAAGVAQSAMSGWDRPTINGPYPDITIVDPNTIFVPGGTGRIVRPSSRDLSGVSEVSWISQNVAITGMSGSWTTVIGVNSTGQIVQLTGGLNAAWARENILLGTVVHVNGQINAVFTRPAIYGDMSYAAYDLTVMFHNQLIRGGRILGNATNPLHLDIESGALFSLGADSDEINSPNIVDFPTQIGISFFPITGTSGVGAATQIVPVTTYDPNGAGVVSAVPGGASTTVIHRLYFMAGVFVLQYGQTTYANLETALNQIEVDNSVNKPATRLTNATLLGYIVVQKDCTDLKNVAQARLVSKGGFDFTIGSAGSISEAPIDGKTYGRNSASWVIAVDDVLPGANVTVDDTNPNKPVVAVPSANLVQGTGVTFTGSGANRILGAGDLTINVEASDWLVVNVNTEMVTNKPYSVTGARDMTLPLNVPAGKWFIVHAVDSTCRIVSNGNTIDGVGPGNNLTLAANETVYLVAHATGTLEVV